MSYPKNPDSIVIQNEFYPKGLREIDIWNYYQKAKYLLLEQVRGRDVFFSIIVDGQEIIRRITKNKNYITLIPSNYDELITGRTISVHSVMRRYEEFGIIDIDCEDFELAKEATRNTVNYLVKNAYHFKDLEIRFTGKTSFHIICYLRNRMLIDNIRDLLRKYLLSSVDLNKNYTVLHARRKGIPNLDLAPNKINGGFITLNSLSTIGLRCLNLDLNELDKFKREQGVILRQK